MEKKDITKKDAIAQDLRVKKLDEKDLDKVSGGIRGVAPTAPTKPI